MHIHCGRDLKLIQAIFEGARIAIERRSPGGP